MDTSWQRSILSIFFILSLDDVNIFCQNVTPSGSQSPLLKSETNRGSQNGNLPNPQLILITTAANGVLPDVQPSLGPVVAGNKHVPVQRITQHSTAAPSTAAIYPQGLLPTSALPPSSGLLNPNLILPPPKIPASLPPSGSFVPPIASPSFTSPGHIPQALLSLSENIGVVQPLNNGQQSAATIDVTVTPSNINTPSSNLLQIGIVRPTPPQKQQQVLNKMASSNCPIAQFTNSMQTDANQVNQLLKKPELVQNPFTSGERRQQSVNQVLSPKLSTRSTLAQVDLVSTSPNAILKPFAIPISPSVSQQNQLQQQFLNRLSSSNNSPAQSKTLNQFPLGNSLNLQPNLSQPLPSVAYQINALLNNEPFQNRFTPPSARSAIQAGRTDGSDLNQFVSKNLQLVNQFPSSNCLATQTHVLTDINKGTPLTENHQFIDHAYYKNYPDMQTISSEQIKLQTNQQFFNQFGRYHCPVSQSNIQPEINLNQFCPSYPVNQPFYNIAQSPIHLQQSQLTNIPRNCICSEVLQVNSQQLTDLQQSKLPLEVGSNIELTTTANSEIEETKQSAVIADESSLKSSINLHVNIPPINLPAPSVTIISTPPSPTVSSPVNAPVVPSFAPYPPIQPIILEGSRSKLKSLLPIMLISLLQDDGGNYEGGGCSCCGSCNCRSNNIPVPFPIPIPVNNPIINNSSSRKGRRSRNNDDEDDEEKE